MTPARLSWVAVVGATSSFAIPPAVVAQTTATVDFGASTVRYDGFVPSAAAAVAPTLVWERPRGSLAMQGTYLRFESGNSSVQGVVTGSLFTAPARRWRGQLLAAVGGSSYADFASFWHTLGEARLHFVGARSGAWIGGAGGRASLGGAPRQVVGATIGAWTRRSSLTLIASAGRSLVGDTAYTDVESSARARHGDVLLQGTVGARLWSRGGGRGVYGEGGATLAVNEHVAVVVSGGRYPTDPIRGTISGRYATVALRLHTTAPRQLARLDPPWRTSVAAGADGTGSSAARLEVLPEGRGVVRLVVRAPGASLVEIAGDFTDWQPIPLGRTDDGSWQGVFRMASGVHRIDVRIDRGDWTVPAGATRAADDYGGNVGIFVVPQGEA